MRLENLISELAARDTVSVAGGEVQFGKCIKEVIGGVPIYDIWALRTGECAGRVVFANIQEIDDFLLESDSSFRYAINVRNLLVIWAIISTTKQEMNFVVLIV